MLGGQSFQQPSLTLDVRTGNTPGTIQGSAQINNFDLGALMGFTSNFGQQQPICASSVGQTGQPTFGRGVQQGNQWYLIDQLAMSGVVQVPVFNQLVPAPVFITIRGQSCQGGGPAVLNLFTRQFIGCISLVVGNQSQFFFQSQ